MRCYSRSSLVWEFWARTKQEGVSYPLSRDTGASIGEMLMRLWSSRKYTSRVAAVIVLHLGISIPPGSR